MGTRVTRARRVMDLQGGLALGAFVLGQVPPILPTLVGLVLLAWSRAWPRRDKWLAVALIAALWVIPFPLAVILPLDGFEVVGLLVFPYLAGPIAAALLAISWWRGAP